jgi:hypothetical protein
MKINFAKGIFSGSKNKVIRLGYWFDFFLLRFGVENNPPLRLYDPNIQENLAYYIHQIKGSTFIIETNLQAINEKAINTIAFLKKEYHLEE